MHFICHLVDNSVYGSVVKVLLYRNCYSFVTEAGILDALLIGWTHVHMLRHDIYDAAVSVLRKLLPVHRLIFEVCFGQRSTVAALVWAPNVSATLQLLLIFALLQAPKHTARFFRVKNAKVLKESISWRRICLYVTSTTYCLVIWVFVIRTQLLNRLLDILIGMLLMLRILLYVLVRTFFCFHIWIQITIVVLGALTLSVKLD